jgi:hypothetical protein
MARSGRAAAGAGLTVQRVFRQGERLQALTANARYTLEPGKYAGGEVSPLPSSLSLALWPQPRTRVQVPDTEYAVWKQVCRALRSPALLRAVLEGSRFGMHSQESGV